jgi:hypothetical protein
LPTKVCAGCIFLDSSSISQMLFNHKSQQGNA